MAIAAPGQRFIEGVARSMGADVALLARPGTTVIADASRVGSRRVACYQIGRHALLPCDPAIIGAVVPLERDDASLDDADFRSWAAGVGATVLGQAVMKVTGPDGLRLAESTALVHLFDWSTKADIELMQAFVDASSVDDLDEAEIAMDDLDAHALALLGADGSIQTFASSRPYEDELSFGDIGIISTPSVRSRGWGRSAVSALIRDVLVPAGVEPLYRCDTDNVGSDRLSEALGFETVVALTVAELPGA